MPTPEAKVKLKLTARLKDEGWWFFKPVSNGMGVHGIPDFVCAAPITITADMVGKTVGVMVGLETKKAGVVQVTPRQRIQLTRIREVGGVAEVINATNVGFVDTEWLRSILMLNLVGIENEIFSAEMK